MWRVTKEHFFQSKGENGMEHIHPVCTWIWRRMIGEQGKKKKEGKKSPQMLNVIQLSLKYTAQRDEILILGYHIL